MATKKKHHSHAEIFAHPATLRKKRKQEQLEHGDEPDPKRQRVDHDDQSKRPPLKSFGIRRNYRLEKKLEALASDPKNLKKSFQSIGVCRELCIATKRMEWVQPTKIQKECIPHILMGKDIIALAETGSGKTGAFALPMIQ